MPRPETDPAEYDPAEYDPAEYDPAEYDPAAADRPALTGLDHPAAQGYEAGPVFVQASAESLCSPAST
ncbi:hypothetical protein ACFQV6_26470 [Actinoplanes sp. GCM10030250]